MAKCLPGCQCKRHSSYVRTPDMRARASEQMTIKWQERSQDQDQMLSIRAAMSAGHEGEWTEERRASVSYFMRQRPHSLETNEKRSRTMRSKPSRGFSIEATGYKRLTGMHDHPLSTSGGVVAEHRKVLYDAIGPGPHACYWNDQFGCGRASLDWVSICVDHLDGDTLNNDLENLVVSCRSCNTKRGSREYWQVRGYRG